MKFLFAAVALGAALTGVSPADDKKDEKKGPALVGAYLVTANGFEIGKAFEADPRKARDNYSPTKPPPGVLGGRIVNVSGVVAKVRAISLFKLCTLEEVNGLVGVNLESVRGGSGTHSVNTVQ